MPIGMKATMSADTSQFKEQMEQMKSSATNVGRELKKTTKDIQTMTSHLRQMSEEEKNSPFGQFLQDEIRKATQAAGDLADIRADIQQNIAAMASDTAIWDGVAQGIAVTRDVVTGFASSMGIATKEGTLMGDTLNMITKAQGLANAAISVGNALQGQSKIITAITLLQKKAETAAINLNTAATGKATIAQRLFNSVAKANPYVLLATAAVAAAGAIMGFVAYSKQAKDEEEELNNELDTHVSVAKSVSEAHQEANGNIAEGITKVNLLYEAVKDSNVSLEDRRKALKKLQELVPDYHGALTEEGTLIDDNADSIDNYCQKLIKMATAQAYYNKLVSAETALLNARDKVQAKQLEISKNAAQQQELIANDKAYKKVGGYMSGGEVVDEQIVPTGAMLKLQSEANKLSSELATLNADVQSAQTAIEGIKTQMKADTSIAEIINSIDTGTKGGGKNGGTTNTPKVTSVTKTDNDKFTEARTEFANEVKKWKRELEAGRISQNEYNKNVLTAGESFRNKLMSLDVSPELTEEWTKQLTDIIAANSQLKDAIAAQEKAEKDAASAAALLKNALQNAANTVTENADFKRQGYKTENSPSSESKYQLTDYTKSKQEIALEYKIKGLDSLKTQLDEINTRINATKDAMDEVNKAKGLDSKEFKQLSDQLSDLESEFERVGDAAENMVKDINLDNATKQFTRMKKELARGVYEGFANSTTAVFGFVDSINAMAEKWDEMSGWEKFEGIFEKVFSGVDTVLGLIETVQTIITLVDGFRSAQEGVTAATNAATIAEAASAAERITSTPELIAANKAQEMSYKSLTAAKNTAAYASIPFAGPGLAASAQAKYVELWGAVKIAGAFAGGGILGGNTSVGDQTLFWGNKGEMILNGQEQSRLFNALKYNSLNNYSSAATNSNVEFVIKGQNLVGVYKNYNKKLSKI